MTNFILRNPLGEVIGSEDAENESEARRKFLARGGCDLRPAQVSASEGKGIGTAAKVALGLVALAGTVGAAYAAGLLDSLLGGAPPAGGTRPATADPTSASQSTGGAPPPPAPPGGPPAEVREYVLSDTSPLALSRLRELAGVGDLPSALAELEAANPGIDISSLAPGVALRVPFGWPARPGLYRAVPGGPAAARPPATPTPPGAQHAPAAPRGVTVHPDGQKVPIPGPAADPARPAAPPSPAATVARRSSPLTRALALPAAPITAVEGVVKALSPAAFTATPVKPGAPPAGPPPVAHVDATAPKPRSSPLASLVGVGGDVKVSGILPEDPEGDGL